jgi:splicing factor 3A subunit 3
VLCCISAFPSLTCPTAIALLFSGEEGYGKYLDLYANHTAYNNLKNVGKRPGYLQYLDLLLAAQNTPVHSDLSRETRSTKDFETFVTPPMNFAFPDTLLPGTLRTCTIISYPLLKRRDLWMTLNLSNTRRPRNLTVNGRLERFLGGRNKSTQSLKQMVMVQRVYGVLRVSSSIQGHLFCLMLLPLSYSGQKNYSKQTVYDAHLTSKKHVKAVARQASSGEPQANPNGAPPPGSTPVTVQQSSAKSRLRNSAYCIHMATDLLITLVPTLNETKSNVERRFSLTAREREQELLEQSNTTPAPAAGAVDGAAEEEEEEERIYNPLKLPLGWDGKPIPYWLYKLHGLGVEYRCEICSDHVYMGR